MAKINKILFKRSKTPGIRPTPDEMSEGELFINTADRVLLSKGPSGLIDLGFAKGGDVDGNITQTSGNFSSTGNVTANNGVFTSEAASKLKLVDTKDVPGYNYLEFFDKTVRKAYIGFGSNDLNTFVIRNDRGNGTLQFNDKIHFNGVQLMDYNNITQTRGESTTLVPSVKLVSDWMETKTNKTDAENTYVKRTGSVLSGTLNFNNKAPTTYAMEAHGNSSDLDSINRLRRFRSYNSGTLYHEVVSNKGLEYFHGAEPTTLMFRISSNGYITAKKGIFIQDNIDATNSNGISGAVASGAFVDWKIRPSMIEVRNTTTNGVSNIFKLVSSTGTAIAALDGYSTTGDTSGTIIRLVWGGREVIFRQEAVQFNAHVSTGGYNVTANQLIATNNSDYVGVKLLKNDGHSLTLETAPNTAPYVGRLIYRNPSNANISITDIPRKNGVLAIQSENYTKAEADNRFAPLAFFGSAGKESAVRSPNFSATAGYYMYINDDGYFGVYNRASNRSVIQSNKDGLLTANTVILQGYIEAKNSIACVQAANTNVRMEMKTTDGTPQITANFGSAWTVHKLQNKTGTLAHREDHYTKGETYTRAEVDSKISVAGGDSATIIIPRWGLSNDSNGKDKIWTAAKTITFNASSKPSRVFMKVYWEFDVQSSTNWSQEISPTNCTINTIWDERPGWSNVVNNSRRNSGWAWYWIDIPANTTASVRIRSGSAFNTNNVRKSMWHRVIGTRLTETPNYAAVS